MDRDSFSSDDELLLIRAVCDQDRRALAILYLKYAPQVRSYIASGVGSAADIDDLLHDVFLQVCRGKGHYDTSKGVEPYIFGIVRNVVRRYRGQKERALKIVPADSMDGLSLRYHIRESIAPVSRISARQWKKMLARSGVDLAAKLLEAIELRVIKGLSCEEAARKIGCSKRAFQKRIERAKKLLRDALKPGF